MADGSRPADATSFLILHGLDNEQPPDHWHHWLADRLRDRGLAIGYPALPDPFEPRRELWRASVLRALDGLPSPAVLVCHSLACLLWVRMASDGDLPAAERVLLVSPPHDSRLPNSGADFIVSDIDAQRVRRATRVPARIVRGTDDDYLPGGPPPWAEAIGAEVDVLPGVGHITPDDGHGPWPSVERWCLDPSERIVA